MPEEKTLLTWDDAADVVGATPARVLDILNANFLPYNFDDYSDIEKAFVAREYRLKLEALTEQLKSIESYGYVMAEGLTLPDGWTLHTINRAQQHVDAEALRNLDPEAYEDLAYIENSDCVKLLGRQRLRNAIRTFKQAECLPAFERINVKEAKTRLTAAAFEEVAKTEQKLDYKFLTFRNLGTEAKKYEWDWDE